MIATWKNVTLAALVTAVLAIPSHAQLRITEVLPTGSGDSPYAADWFELTNTGGSSVNISGYTMDDNSNSFAVSVLLNGITSIAPGESVIFLESSAVNFPTVLPAFQSAWFVSTPPGLQIGRYSGSGVGLGNGGDAVNIFDSFGVLIDSVSFGAATTDVTFGYNPDTSTFGALSVAGTHGAYTAPSGEIGSPGAIPEPSTWALLILGSLGAFVLHRKKTASAVAR
jgi:hypothetical protein